MRTIFRLSVVIPFIMMAAGCSDAGAKSTIVERSITVAGTANDVARFSAYQVSSAHPLKVSSTETLPNGKAQLSFTVPAEYSSTDLSHAEKEALTRGLSYGFKERRVDQTKGGLGATTT
jgi:hypothetical protein